MEAQAFGERRMLFRVAFSSIVSRLGTSLDNTSEHAGPSFCPWGNKRAVWLSLWVDICSPALLPPASYGAPGDEPLPLCARAEQPLNSCLTHFYEASSLHCSQLLYGTQIPDPPKYGSLKISYFLFAL